MRIDHAAEKQLRRLDRKHLPELINRITALGEDPRPAGCRKLKGSRRGGWRIRVGNIRVQYLIDDEAAEVQIYDISPRDKAYRN